MKIMKIHQILYLAFLIKLKSVSTTSEETQPAALNNYSIDLIPLERLGHTQNPNEIRCYGVFGCFSIGFPWKSKQRGLSVL